MKLKSTILVASNSKDRITTDPVIASLERKGHTVLVYESDLVAKGVQPFSLQFVGEGKVEFMYGGQEIDPATIRAAWFRRPTDFGIKYEDIAKELCLSREKRESQDLFFRFVPPAAWLNNPDSIDRAEHKMWQLREAESFGFTIPRTIISNSWKNVTAYFADADKIIFKMPFGELFIQNTLKTMGARILTKKQLQTIKGLPFPGICQEYITKKREWRVTVIGSQVFAAAIYTHTKAKDDWREHQFNKELVQFKPGEFPKKESDQCVGFLQHLGLRFGAFDFIEDESGRIVFLEVNPSGQYGWLEASMDLPISEAIASELSLIAGDSPNHGSGTFKKAMVQ